MKSDRMFSPTTRVVRTSADDAARDLAAARAGCDPALATFGVSEVYQRLERNGTTVIGGPS